MLGIFDDINTLDCLKKNLTEKENSEAKAQLSTKGFECYLEKLYNIPNASRIVTDWINTLIGEYNKRYENFELQEKSFYNRCLYKTFDYFLPFLATYEKMETLINMCSLVDDEDEENKDFHLEFFDDSVRIATEYAKEIHFLELVNNNRVDNGNNLLYLLGFFNFRIQNYDTAITYLKPCVTNRLNEISNDESIHLYIRSVIYLAESYEYKSDLDSALKQLIGSDGTQLKQHLNNKCVRIDISRYVLTNYSNISKDKNGIQYIKDIYKYLHDSQSNFPTSYKVFQLKDVNESLKSFVHVTAHCLSEYAAQCMDKVSKMQGKRTNEIRIYSLLQQVSRFLMDWLVIQDDSYVTCQATIRAENDACPEAIDILIKRLEEFNNFTGKKLSVTKKMERAELQFYIFYFAEQELNINNNKDNLLSIFEKYGAEFYKFVIESKDTNALFHYLIIRFKYLLKKSAQDILERNKLADYTELDKIYYKISECRKQPLPHVFQELIEESNRLIKAYLLLREYRYLFTKDPNSYNMQEFYNRLELNKYSTMTDKEELKSEMLDDEEIDIEDANIIKILIDEIETKKRILILAPVKAAPSCSLDYVPISRLNKLNARKNELEDFKSIYQLFQPVSVEHGKKKGMNKVLQCDNVKIVKWVIYYDIAIDALFLYYNEQKYEIKGGMFKANLSENEKSHLGDLFKALEKFFFNQSGFQVDCNQEEHERIYESGGACTTWLIKGSDISGNDKLLDILIFSEFDFYSLSDSHKIDNDDYMMFSVNKQCTAKYKIVCFSKLPDTKETGICNYCVCVDEEEIQSTVTDSRDLSQSATNIMNICTYNGETVNLQKLKDKINERIYILQREGYKKTSQTIEDIRHIHDEICKCCDGICRNRNNVNNCEWLDKCVENDIILPE